MGGAVYTQDPWCVHSTGVELYARADGYPAETLEELELVQRDSTKRMEGLWPRVEDFLVKFTRTNETQLGAITKGLVEVG